ncbi:MAG: hypothetical protein RL385_225 [Pseudomonadota bacterium]|jgi:hypothetical protein
MKMPVDPPRLLDPRAGADAELREALRLVSRELPSAAVVEAFADHVAKSVGQGTSIGGGVSVVSHPVWIKALTVVTLTAVGGASLWWARADTRMLDVAQVEARANGPSPMLPSAPLPALEPAFPQTTRSAPSSVAQGELTAGAAAAMPGEGDAARPSQSAQAMRASARTSRLQRLAGGRGAPAGGSTFKPEPAAERNAEESREGAAAPFAPASAAQDDAALVLIARAQRALQREPAHALSLLTLHRARYPHGGLAEERDVLSLDAMAQLGMLAELSRSAREFLRSYPQSMHRQRVLHLLAQAERSDADAAGDSTQTPR